MTGAKLFEEIVAERAQNCGALLLCEPFRLRVQFAA